MSKVMIFLSLSSVLLFGCADSRPTTSSASGTPVSLEFDPEAFPEVTPEDEPEGGYATLASLIESGNATPDRVQNLLNLGADVMERGNRGWTPLHWAASNSRDPEVIALLLQAGADVHATASGFVPLHCAAMVNPNPNIILMLLEGGAEVNARLDSGENPLWMACSSAQKNPAIIQLLLAKGADANKKNSIGEVPLDFARRNDALKGSDTLEALKSATSFFNR